MSDDKTKQTDGPLFADSLSSTSMNASGASACPAFISRDLFICAVPTLSLPACNIVDKYLTPHLDVIIIIIIIIEFILRNTVITSEALAAGRISVHWKPGWIKVLSVDLKTYRVADQNCLWQQVLERRCWKSESTSSWQSTRTLSLSLSLSAFVYRPF